MQITSHRDTLKVNLSSERLYLIIIMAVALVYRLLPLNRGLGEDELFTTVQFIEVPSIFRTIFYNIAFNNHIGYSVMARLSEAIFGRAEWVLRLPALLLGMATLYVFYLFSQPLLGRSAALLATFLLALSPAHIRWSVEARGYSAVIFFTLVSSYLFFRLLRQPNRKDKIKYIVANVLAIYVHLYAVFVIGVQVLYLLYLTVIPSARGTSLPSLDKASLRLFRNTFLAIGGFVFILYTPVAWFMLRDIAGRGWSHFNPFFPWEVAQELAGSHRFVIVGLVVLVTLLGWFSLHQRYRLETTYFAWLLLVPLLLMWFIHPFDLYPRFFAYWLPYLLILFTAGMIKLLDPIGLERKIVLYFTRAFAFCVLLAALFSWTMEWQNVVSDEGYREVSQSVLRNADPLAAYCAIGGSRSVWKYYISKPIVYPLTLADFQKLSSTHPEVRCVYYAAPWQDKGQAQIAQFLFQHASSFSVKELTWFVFRSDTAN